MVLLWISLKVNDFEHIFISLLEINLPFWKITFLEKCQSHWWTVLLVLLWLSCKSSLVVNKWFIAHYICNVLFVSCFFVVVVVLSSFLNAVFIETPKVTKTQSSIYFEEFHNVESIYFSNFLHINCTYWLLLPLIPTFLSCSGWFTLFCVPQRLTWAIFVIRDLELCIGACWPQQWEHS